MDYVDLYLLHWPLKGMRPVEIMAALAEVVQSGKARCGVLELPRLAAGPLQRDRSQEGWPQLINNQVAYNLFERGIEVEILPQAVADGIAITAYRPIAEGVLAGRYQVGGPFPAGARGESSGPVIAWLSQHGDSIERFVRYAADLRVPPGHWPWPGCATRAG